MGKSAVSAVLFGFYGGGEKRIRETNGPASGFSLALRLFAKASILETMGYVKKRLRHLVRTASHLPHYASLLACTSLPVRGFQMAHRWGRVFLCER